MCQCTFNIPSLAHMLRSLSTDTITERFATEYKESFNSLNHLQWHLKWRMGSDQRSVLLTLQCVPDHEIVDKVQNVMILLGLHLYSGDESDENVVVKMPIQTMVRLTKETDYQYTLLHDSTVNPPSNDSMSENVSLSKFDNACITYNVSLFFLGLFLDEHKLDFSNFLGIAVKEDLSTDIGAMLSFDSTKRSKFSDVTLVASPNGDSSQPPVEFFAHKVILAARSPVFAKMFEHEMQESLNNRIEIDDIDPEVIMEMLVYMYTGDVPDIKVMADDLFYVADKYELVSLRMLCEEHLSYNLRVDNAVRLVQLAFTHNAPQLKKNALKFIAKKAAEVRATKEWAEVIQGNEILDELIETMVEPAPPAKKRRTD